VVAPVFTDEELESLRRFPEIGREELFRFFTLTPADSAFIRAIADHRPRRRHPSSELLDEVLLLTKMNWNSARFAEQTPVTVRFAGQVGEILRDLPDDYTPEHRYAFYM
jgi:hypothetical protein